MIAVPRTDWLIKENIISMWILSVFTHGLGDGMAELVGVRFGKHK